ncbi:MAG TPA: Plug domain-containing protein, partial [Longimicrobiaceae bacterium]
QDGKALLQLRHARENVIVRRLGYGEERREVAPGPTALEVALTPAPVVLATVDATSRRPPLSPPLQRFYQRVERGRGAFLTREQIERRKPRRLTDLFREIPGVRVTTTPRGERLMMTGATPTMYRVNPRWEAGDCPVQYYLDGVTYLPDYAGVPNDVRPDEVEGIEVYRRLSEVPVEYRRPGADCGVVLIWLKERA